MAQLARERLVGATAPDERLFFEAVVELGHKAERVFAAVDASEAREAVARAAQPAHEAALRAKVEAAFETERARQPPVRLEPSGEAWT